MADGWLLWAGAALAAAFAVLIAAAGYALVGVFLGAAIWLAARAAVTPETRQRADDAMVRVLDRLSLPRSR